MSLMGRWTWAVKEKKRLENESLASTNNPMVRVISCVTLSVDYCDYCTYTVCYLIWNFLFIVMHYSVTI